MKKLLLILASAAALFAQSYPSSIYTPLVARDNLQTTLNTAMAAGDTTAFVASTTRWAANMVGYVCDTTVITGGIARCTGTFEVMLVTAVPGANALTVTRGYGGTSAIAHAAGKAFLNAPAAIYTNSGQIELAAIEAALGVNLGNVPRASSINPVTYNFTTQTPSGTLSPGSNTITMTPVPLGVNGTDVSHYLYVAGTGTPEACLINGGSGTAGQNPGQISILCANSHSAGWTIQSATAGAQEAAVSLIASGGGQITFPGGAFNLYGPFVAPTTVVISGSGAGTVLTVNQTTGTVFSFTGSGISYGLTNLQMKTAGGTPRNVIAVNVGVNGTFAATGLIMSGFAVYFNISGATEENYIANNVWSNPFTSAIGVAFDTPGTSVGNTVIHANTLTGSPGGFLAAVYFASTAVTSGVWISNNDFFQPSYGIYLGPVSGGSAGQVFSSSNAYQSTQLSGIIAAPAGTGYVRAIMSIGDNIETGLGTGIALGGFGGTVDNVNISTCTIDLNAAAGIQLRSGATNTTISNCTVAGNSQSASGTLPAILVDAAVSKFVITGNVLGPAEGTPTDANSQNYGVQVLAGASDNYSITGNYIPANATGTISDLGTGTHKVIAFNLGVDTAALATVASATTIAMPATDAPVIYVSGTTTVTTINGGWVGRRITLIKTDAGTLAVGGGGNVPVAVNLIAASNPSRTLTFDGTNWY